MTKSVVIITIVLSLCGSLSGRLLQLTIQDLEPPEPSKVALMARYIIHKSDWISVASISTRDTIKSYPFVSLKSLSDGPEDNSTGIPYLYMTDMDVTGHDLLADNRLTIMASLAEGDYCKTENFDPQDPRCAKVMITGKYIKVEKASLEYTFGKDSLFDRHPEMRQWPDEHNFYVAKVDPVEILVLDYFGGLKEVSKEDYFNANITNIVNADAYFQRVSVVEINVN